MEYAEYRRLYEKVTMSAPVLTSVGQYQIAVENYRELYLISETKIELLAYSCRIKIEGEHLCVKYYSKNIIKISGNIRDIQYLDL